MPASLFLPTTRSSNRRAEAFAEKTKEKTGAGALFPLVIDTVAEWLDETGDKAPGRACPPSSVAVRAPAAAIAFTP
jgi:hypothetical protein